MATQQENAHRIPEPDQEEGFNKLVSSFIGLSFSVFLALLPRHAPALLPRLQAEVRELRRRLVATEEQLRQMKSRRKEDSKANARVVEIFASHRNAWQAEEKRLLERIEGAEREVFSLTAKIREMEHERDESQSRIRDLEREVGEREEMIGFMSRTGFEEEEGEESTGFETKDPYDVEEIARAARSWNGASDLVTSFASTDKFWPELPNNCIQDLRYESTTYRMKQFGARRESPWRLDGEPTGVAVKLSLLEQELLNLEKVSQSDLSKVPSLLRKQTKRYQSLAGKIEDLCRRMQDSDPCEPTLSPEFRTQRQTEFLLESFRLQQRASETRQKLVALQTEIGKVYYGEELGNQAKLATRRSLDLVRNNLKEVQRNLEIWLARIIGDVEGILARDGASRVRELYISRYPFVQ